MIHHHVPYMKDLPELRNDSRWCGSIYRTQRVTAVYKLSNMPANCGYLKNLKQYFPFIVITLVKGSNLRNIFRVLVSNSIIRFTYLRRETNEFANF